MQRAGQGGKDNLSQKDNLEMSISDRGRGRRKGGRCASVIQGAGSHLPGQEAVCFGMGGS